MTRAPSKRWNWRATASVVLIIIGAVVLFVLSERARWREWRDARSPANIMGKSADEIQQFYGKPYFAERDRDKRLTLIVYKDVKHPQYCWIKLENGVAVNVGFSGQ